MNSMLRLLLEIGPLLVFFGAYRVADGDLLAATGAFMAAVVASLAASLAMRRKVPKMMAVTAVVVLVFGALTLWLEDAAFIKMKPTIVNGLFAMALAVGLARGTSYLRFLLDEAIAMDDEGWRQLTVRWLGFFAAMAVLNEAVWRTQTEEVWITVKTFGYLPLTMAFALLQWPLMKRHWRESE